MIEKSFRTTANILLLAVLFFGGISLSQYMLVSPVEAGGSAPTCPSGTTVATAKGTSTTVCCPSKFVKRTNVGSGKNKRTVTTCSPPRGACSAGKTNMTLTDFTNLGADSVALVELGEQTGSSYCCPTGELVKFAKPGSGKGKGKGKGRDIQDKAVAKILNSCTPLDPPETCEDRGDCDTCDPTSEICDGDSDDVPICYSSPVNGVGGGPVPCDTEVTPENEGAAKVGSILCSPGSISAGDFMQVSWACLGSVPLSSVGTNFDTNGDSSGFKTLQPLEDTTYSVTCSNNIDGLPSTETKSCRVFVDEDADTVVCVPSPSMTCNGGSASAIFSASPILVSAGSTSTISWNLENLLTCSIQGVTDTGIEVDNWDWNIVNSLTEKLTNPILTKTTYTLSCKDLDRIDFSETVIIHTAPTWQER